MDSRYEIRDEVGQGGVGIVYEAWDRKLSRKVAIKRLLPITDEVEAEARESNKSAVNDLLREASILSAMQHPNIVAVFDAGIDEEGAFVVMELIDGEVLRDAVERGPLVNEDFMEVVEQTLDALISAHHHGLLHRDIKPRNLMFKWLPSEKFQVKLLDFGLAKFSSKPEKQTQAYKDTIMGSSAYMAPEQFIHEDLDARTDLYQLGCVYYYILTGILPFDGETPADIMESHLQHRVKPLGEMRPDLQPALTSWIMSLIERDPDNRPSTAKRALQGFRHARDPKTALDDEDTAPVFIGGAKNEGVKSAFMVEDVDKANTKESSMKWVALALGLMLGGGFFAMHQSKEGKAETPGEPIPSQAEEVVLDSDGNPVLLASNAEAIASYVDQEVTVRGRVTRTGMSKAGTSFLNFEEPHFFIVSFPSDRPFFRLDPYMLYEMKEIEVKGTILAFEDRYQIKLTSPDQVKVIE